MRNLVVTGLVCLCCTTGCASVDLQSIAPEFWYWASEDLASDASQLTSETGCGTLINTPSHKLALSSDIEGDDVYIIDRELGILESWIVPYNSIPTHVHDNSLYVASISVSGDMWKLEFSEGKLSNFESLDKKYAEPTIVTCPSYVSEHFNSAYLRCIIKHPNQVIAFHGPCT